MNATELKHKLVLGKDQKKIFCLIVLCFILGQTAGGYFAAINSTVTVQGMEFFALRSYAACFLPIWGYCAAVYIFGLGPAGLMLIPCEAALRGFLFSAKISAFYRYSDNPNLITLVAANLLQVLLITPIFLVVCMLMFRCSGKTTGLLIGKGRETDFIVFKRYLIYALLASLLIAAAAAADYYLTPKLISLAASL